MNMKSIKVLLLAVLFMFFLVTAQQQKNQPIIIQVSQNLIKVPMVLNKKARFLPGFLVH